MLNNAYYDCIGYSSCVEHGHIIQRRTECLCVPFLIIVEDVEAVYGLCEVCCVLIAFVLAFDTDGESKLQRAAAVQKEKKRGLQWGGRGGREAWENPQMYCGESAMCLGCH